MAKRASTEIQEIVYLTEEIGNKAGFPGQFYVGKQHGGKKHGEGYLEGFLSFWSAIILNETSIYILQEKKKKEF